MKIRRTASSAASLLMAAVVTATVVHPSGPAAAAPTAASTIRFAGTVVEAGDYPVPGVLVTLVREDDDATVVAHARTDARGYYRLPAVPRSSRTLYTLTTSDPSGFHEDAQVEDVPATAARAAEDIQLSGAGVIRGQVSTQVGDDREPATHVVVSAIGDRAFVDVQVARSGAFRIGALPPGTYRVEMEDSTGRFTGICYDQLPATDGCYTTTAVKVTSGRVTTLRPQVLDHLAATTAAR